MNESTGWNRREATYAVLLTAFCVVLVLTNIVGVKLFHMFPDGRPGWLPGEGPLTLTTGIITYPMTFVLTDLVAEIWGRKRANFMVVLGFGVATGTVAAHAVGAGNLSRARAAGHVGAGMCAVVMGLTATTFFFWPEALVGLFTDDPTTLRIAAGYIATMAFCQIPQAAEMVYGDAMAGAGSATLAACVSIPGNVLRVPLAWVFAIELDWGLEGVWWAIVASALLKGVGMWLLYLSGRWERAMLAGRGMLESA